jgi:hypothetical protein
MEWVNWDNLSLIIKDTQGQDELGDNPSQNIEEVIK